MLLLFLMIQCDCRNVKSISYCGRGFLYGKSIPDSVNIIHLIIITTSPFATGYCNGLTKVPNLRRLIYGTLRCKTHPFTIRRLPYLTQLDLYRCGSTHGSLLLNFFTSLKFLTITSCEFTDIKFPVKSTLFFLLVINSKLLQPYMYGNEMPNLNTIHIHNSIGFQEFISQPSLRFISFRNIIVNLFIIRTKQLRGLCLRDVILTGKIPQHFGTLPLKVLKIFKTNVDEFPESFTNLSELEKLEIMFDSPTIIRAPNNFIRVCTNKGCNIKNVNFVH